MPYTRFTAAQVQTLRQHYQDHPPTHFAQQWGVDMRQVYRLAERHGIKRRAPNWAPVWRGRSEPWASSSRWA